MVALNDLNFDFSFLRLSGLTFKETHFQARHRADIEALDDSSKCDEILNEKSK